MPRTFGFCLLGAVLVAAGACSLYLDWDPDGLPCGADNKCADGYSCMVNKCVADGSIPEGETCSQEQQCEGAPDVTCGSNPFTCRKFCSELYQTTSTCVSGEYCRPELNRGTVGETRGTCVGSECNVNEDCQSSVCVQVTSSATACMQLCEYDFDPDYTDRCTGTSSGQEQYCQTVGPPDNLTFVCLDLGEGVSWQEEKGPCDPVIQPCGRGLVCARRPGEPSTCYKLCFESGVNECVTGAIAQECLPLEGAAGQDDPEVRICVPACDSNGC